MVIDIIVYTALFGIASGAESSCPILTVFGGGKCNFPFQVGDGKGYLGNESFSACIKDRYGHTSWCPNNAVTDSTGPYKSWKPCDNSCPTTIPLAPLCTSDLGHPCQFPWRPNDIFELEACYNSVCPIITDTNDKPIVEGACSEDCPMADCSGENPEWMEWGPCSKSCGNGIKERRRRLKAFCYKVDSTSCNKGPYTYDVC